MKKFNYNFTSGGWNQEQANTKSEAIAQAKKRWSECGSNLKVDEQSFRIATDEETKNLMGLFY